MVKSEFEVKEGVQTRTIVSGSGVYLDVTRDEEMLWNVTVPYSKASEAKREQAARAKAARGEER